MHILVGTHYFESHRGGIEIVAGQLARRFRQLGATVIWLASDASPPPSEDCGEAVPVPCSNLVERRVGIPFPIPLPTALTGIWRTIAEADVVMLHDSLYLTNVALRIAAAIAGKPVVIVQHIGAVPYKNPLLRGLMALANRLVARPMLAAADQVVFISETTVRHFAEVRLRQAPKVILNGVDASIFHPRPDHVPAAALRARHGLPDDRPVALFVGRFVEKKGLHVLERLARALPDVTFAFAGWGPLDPERWLLPNVHVLRHLEGARLAPLYQASDLFVLPSTGEGLPLVLQEALSCGLPILCGAETAGADEVLEEFATGIPIDEADLDGTVEAFRAAIVEHIGSVADMDEVLRRSAACRARYDWSATARAHLAVLRDCIEDAARSRSGTRAENVEAS